MWRTTSSAVASRPPPIRNPEWLVEQHQPRVLLNDRNGSLYAPFLRLELNARGSRLVHLAYATTVPSLRRLGMNDYDYYFLFGQSSLEALQARELRFGCSTAVLVGSHMIDDSYLMPAPDLATRTLLIAEKSRELGIDIAVDLKGYTGNARFGAFVHRCAPVQVSYLGYPGTTGAKCIDYIIADAVVAPEEYSQGYSESVVRLPDCYQPNNSQRKISSRTFIRAEVGLPENCFVYCSFNANYKITPEIFDCWMNILRGNQAVCFGFMSTMILRLTIWFKRRCLAELTK